MPEYSFWCDRCGSAFEVFMSLAQYNPTQDCPSCKMSDEVHRDYQADNVSGNVALRTLGAIADKNTSKMSEDQKQNLWRKHNEYRFGPKPELPKGFSRIDQEKPFEGQERKKKSKRQVRNLY